ncbi:MAG: sigma-70 family RNA polymerase sigma factor [Candidatus Cloacimonadaceae bacterium]|jgi:RNA polymerase sigma factor (sigma-70 family)
MSDITLNTPEDYPKNQDELIQSYAKLAYGICKSYQNYGMPLEDLRQEALIGLLMAYERFDSSKGTLFSTYAVYWIKKQILQALDRESMGTSYIENYAEHNPEQSNPEKVSEKLTLPVDMPEREAQVLRLSYEKKLTIKEIAQQLQITNEQTKQLRSKALRRIKGHFKKGGFLA